MKNFINSIKNFILKYPGWSSYAAGFITYAVLNLFFPYSPLSTHFILSSILAMVWVIILNLLKQLGNNDNQT